MSTIFLNRLELDWYYNLTKGNKMKVLSIIRGMACIVLILCGGLIATQVNALLGCLVTATGMLALLAPFIIESDEKIRQNKLQRVWERYNDK